MIHDDIHVQSKKEIIEDSSVEIRTSFESIANEFHFTELWFIFSCRFSKQKWYRKDNWFINKSIDNSFENGLFDECEASTATTNINIVKYDLFYAIIVASEFGGDSRNEFAFIEHSATKFGSVFNIC